MLPDAKDIREAKAMAKTLCACNYAGECVALDCDCIIQISPSSLAEGKILCNYFRDNVLPENTRLESIFNDKPSGKFIRCKVCGAAFTARGNRAKYCDRCKATQHRKQKAKWYREYYAKQTQNTRKIDL